MYQKDFKRFAGLPYHTIPIDEYHHFAAVGDYFIGVESSDFYSLIERLEEAHYFSMTATRFAPLTWKMIFSIRINPGGVLINIGKNSGYIATPKGFIKLLNDKYILFGN